MNTQRDERLKRLRNATPEQKAKLLENIVKLLDDDTLPMDQEEIDEELRSADYDPETIGRDMLLQLEARLQGTDDNA